MSKDSKNSGPGMLVQPRLIPRELTEREITRGVERISQVFFIRRPIVAMVIAILTVIVGVVMTAELPVAQFPNIAPPEMRLTATYVGADSKALEQSVATPIEEQINGVDNLELHVFGQRDGQFKYDAVHRLRSQDRSQHGFGVDAVS